jgi:hypothetical protein
MHFMNQWDIEESVSRHRNHPVLARATRFLYELMKETDNHSDGWAYWSLPIKSANKLMTLIESGDATESQYKSSLVPIRSFYTRRGNAAGMTFPQV